MAAGGSAAVGACANTPKPYRLARLRAAAFAFAAIGDACRSASHTTSGGCCRIGTRAALQTRREFQLVHDFRRYDYDGILTEDARIRVEKYLPMQKMLWRFWKSMGNDEMVAVTQKKLPVDNMLLAYAGRVRLKESVALLDLLGVAAECTFYSERPFYMEEAGSGHGFVLYRHKVNRALYKDTLHAPSLKLGPIRNFAYFSHCARALAQFATHDGQFCIRSLTVHIWSASYSSLLFLHLS
eukprot:IDg21787t1